MLLVTLCIVLKILNIDIGSKYKININKFILISFPVGNFYFTPNANIKLTTKKIGENKINVDLNIKLVIFTVITWGSKLFIMILMQF